jgi:predicted phosphoribosyltransferase
MSYKDRRDAGRKLAGDLAEYKQSDSVIVLAIPRGGVILGYEVAMALNAPLDVIIPRKIGAPGNPELAVGAVTEDGARVLNEEIVNMLGISKNYLEEITEREIAEIRRRALIYREGRSSPNLEHKTVIIVDDGLATGATMKAAIKSVRERKASRIVVAVPVAPPDTIRQLSKQADKTVCPVVYEPFYAIGQFYTDFDQVSDEEVVQLLRKTRTRDKPSNTN